MERKSPRKLSLLALLITGPSLSFNAYGLSGTSVGVGLGTEYLSANMSTTSSVNGIVAQGSSQQNTFGAIGSIFAGYGTTLGDWFYVGAEAGLNAVSQKSISLSANGYNQFTATGFDADTGAGVINMGGNVLTNLTASRRTLEPTLDFKPGILVTPQLMFYGRLGASYNQINVTNNINSVATASQNTVIFFTPLNIISGAKATNNYSPNQSYNVMGWRTGFGVSGMLTPNLAIGADYTYSYYNSANVNGAGRANQISCDFIEGCTVSPDGKYSSHGQAKVSSQTVMLQLIYYLQNVC